MQGVERTNVIIIRLQQGTGLVQHNPYAMEVDRGRNCYACGGFRHMAHHCRNQGQRERMAEGRRVEYREGIERNHEYSNNLKEVENLESLD